MSTLAVPLSPPSIVYPDSDGKPMAENTLQYQWIVTITGGLEYLFEPFVTYEELALQREQERRRADRERDRADALQIELERLRREAGPPGAVST